jgi:hypothetical protein
VLKQGGLGFVDEHDVHKAPFRCGARSESDVVEASLRGGTQERFKQRALAHAADFSKAQSEPNSRCHFEGFPTVEELSFNHHF